MVSIHGSIIFFLPAIFLIALASIYKNTDYLLGNITILDSLSSFLNPDFLNAYLAGPVNVNNGIATNYAYNLNINTFIYDLCKSIPIVGNWLPNDLTTFYYFNEFIGRWNPLLENGDSIIPLICQSFIYFGYIGIPVLSVIMVIGIRYADLHILKANDVFIYYYAYLSVFLAACFVLNLTIFAGRFFADLLADAIVFYLLSRVHYESGKLKI